MRRRRFGPFEVVILLAALCLIAVGASGFDQAVRAARADGAPGRFAVTSSDCVSHLGHSSCTCLGDYAADDGSVRLTGVPLVGGGDDCTAGTVRGAVDIGVETRVVDPGGSGEWVVTALILSAGTGLALWAVIPLLRRSRVRSAAR
ncbi:hypothetical protein PWG71_17740 [Nocardiopsis sp. N85]|uniref:hypothetical protein n=1 Tax=Nocardiopsis sp. N85 TaxID=3029400 RepID=UPI00237F29D2|nr:hypothetical protein [Nocardiopsis sp. N85]MDE3723238.1 hypothetical protein [Nocardiopsis sp. N85]